MHTAILERIDNGRIVPFNIALLFETQSRKVEDPTDNSLNEH